MVAEPTKCAWCKHEYTPKSVFFGPVPETADVCRYWIKDDEGKDVCEYCADDYFADAMTERRFAKEK